LSGRSAGPGRRDMRRHDRAPVELPVLVTDSANRVVGGLRFDAADVSQGGAFLRSDLLFEVGELLRLEFTLPSGRVIKAQGRVARVSRDQAADRLPGMGIAFVDLAEADRKAIETFLDS